MDRSSTNINAIKCVKRVTQYSSTMIPCLPHTTSLPRKEFKRSNTLLDRFRKAFNSSIIIRGKFFCLFKDKFSLLQKVACGVRWYFEWEQINEMDQVGVGNIVNALIPEALEKKFSDMSMQKMINVTSQESLLKLIIETAAVAEAGRAFYVATYLPEGDDPIVLGGHIEIAKLEDYIDYEPNFGVNSRTRSRCK